MLWMDPPDASHSKTNSTLILVPLMIGLPPKISGSEMIAVNAFIPKHTNHFLYRVSSFCIILQIPKREQQVVGRSSSGDPWPPPESGCPHSFRSSLSLDRNSDNCSHPYRRAGHPTQSYALPAHEALAGRRAQTRSGLFVSPFGDGVVAIPWPHRITFLGTIAASSISKFTFLAVHSRARFS